MQIANFRSGGFTRKRAFITVTLALVAFAVWADLVAALHCPNCDPASEVDANQRINTDPYWQNYSWSSGDIVHIFGLLGGAHWAYNGMYDQFTKTSDPDNPDPPQDPD